MALVGRGSENAGWSEIGPFLFLTHRFNLERRLFKAFFPHYRRISPTTSSCFRVIHWFDEANSVACCAEFFIGPRKRTFRIAKVTLDHSEWISDLRYSPSRSHAAVISTV